MFKLSILIPSTLDRKEFLQRLLLNLKNQLTPEIEILVELDNGEMSIGEKRNLLVSKATGDYVVQIDDDDRVSDDYIQQLMVGIDKNVDLVSIQGIRTEDGKSPQTFIDIPYAKWQTLKNGTFIRGIQHLDALKREIAVQFKYPHKSFGEDKIWSDTIQASKLVKTFHQIGKPIYFYEYRTTK